MGTLLGNLAWEPLGGTLLGTSSWLLGTVAWEPVPGNLAWEPLAGNPVPNLAPCRSGCPEGFSRKSKLLPGTFPGTRFPADLAAPTCSGTFTMAEDPKLTLLGKNVTYFLKTTPKHCVCHTQRFSTRLQIRENVRKRHACHAKRHYNQL